LLNDNDRAEDERLPPIYWTVAEHIRSRKNEFKTTTLAGQEDFEATVKKRGLGEFFDLLKKAVDTRKNNNKMALLTYSTCSYYRANLVLKVLQVDFGSLHPCLLMILTNRVR
jgi:hypothetical protein